MGKLICGFCHSPINFPRGEEYHFWEYVLFIDGHTFHPQWLVIYSNGDISIRCRYVQKSLRGRCETKVQKQTSPHSKK